MKYFKTVQNHLYIVLLTVSPADFKQSYIGRVIHVEPRWPIQPLRWPFLCKKKKIRFKKKIETRKSNKTRMLLNVWGVFLH